MLSSSDDDWVGSVVLVTKVVFAVVLGGFCVLVLLMYTGNLSSVVTAVEKVGLE